MNFLLGFQFASMCIYSIYMYIVYTSGYGISSRCSGRYRKAGNGFRISIWSRRLESGMGVFNFRGATGKVGHKNLSTSVG